LNRILTALIAFALLVAACGGAADDTDTGSGSAVTEPTATSVPETTATPPETSTTTTQPSGETTPSTEPEENGSSPTESGGESVPGAYPAKVDIAINDLAERLGIDPEAITVRSVDEVTWRDGSLGCPMPGMSYTQALVDGMRIILEVDGTPYHYHSGRGSDPFYCADPSEPLGEGIS
jgi:hypothetical protein